jgi:hypothetical protein
MYLFVEDLSLSNSLWFDVETAEWKILVRASLTPLQKMRVKVLELKAKNLNRCHFSLFGAS